MRFLCLLKVLLLLLLLLLAHSWAGLCFEGSSKSQKESLLVEVEREGKEIGWGLFFAFSCAL